MPASEEDLKIIAAMTKIFLDAFNEAAERTGVPVKIVAQQFIEELEKLEADRERLNAACASYKFPET